MNYIALLRGINVGGNKKVPMVTLTKTLKKAGYADVKTLLASGNVLLEAKEKSAAALRKNLEVLLEKTFGFPIRAIVRTADELKNLAAKDPFKGVTIDDNTRLYVTFLGNRNRRELSLSRMNPRAARFASCSPRRPKS